jgi:hypothetical protein
MKAKKGGAVKDAEFGASRGWCDRFKKRSNLHNIKVQGAAAEEALLLLVLQEVHPSLQQESI